MFVRCQLKYPQNDQQNHFLIAAVVFFILSALLFRWVSLWFARQYIDVVAIEIYAAIDGV